jgi:hypothetical protein
VHEKASRRSERKRKSGKRLEKRSLTSCSAAAAASAFFSLSISSRAFMVLCSSLIFWFGLEGERRVTDGEEKKVREFRWSRFLFFPSLDDDAGQWPTIDLPCLVGEEASCSSTS